MSAAHSPKQPPTPDTSIQDNAMQDVQGFDDPPRKLPKWVKYAGGSMIALTLLAGGAGIVTSNLIDQQKYKKVIIEKVAEKTGYKVDWQGDIALSFLPLPHASVNGLTVSVNDRQILSVKSADVEVALLPLLSNKVEIRDITVEEPKIELVTLKNGQQTWMTEQLKKSQEDSVSDSGSEEEKEASRSMNLSFNVIEISNGVVVWDDQSAGKKQSIEDLDLRLNSESLTGPFEMNGGMLFNGMRVESKITTGELDINNGLYPIQAKLALPDSNVRGEYSGVISAKDTVSAEGDVTLEIADLLSAAKSLSGNEGLSIPKELGGKASLSTKLQYTPEKVVLDNMEVHIGELAYGGNFSIQGLADGNAPPKVSFDLKSVMKSGQESSALVKFMDDLKISATGSMKDSKLVIDQSRIKLNDNELSASGTVKQGEKPTVDLTVSVKKLDIDQLQKKLGSGASGGTSPALTAGGKNKQSSVGMEIPFDGRIRADVAQVTVGGKNYTSINADISSIGNELQISKFSAMLPEDVTVKTSGSISNTKDMSGLDLAVFANIPNTEIFASSYNISLPELPRKIGATSISGKIMGSVKALDFDMGVGVWGLTANGAGTVASPLDNPVINQLKFNFKHPVFVEAMRIIQSDFTSTPGFEGPLSLSGQLAWGDDQYHVTDVKAMFGRTAMSGTMDVATSPKPSVTGDLKIGDLIFPSSASSKKASASGAPSQVQSDKARWSREAIDVAWMKSFNADLKITANSISQNLWRFTNANLEFVLKDGSLEIGDMSAGLFGGQAALNGEIRSGAGDRDPLTVKGKMIATNVDAQKLQSAVMGAFNDTVSGVIKNVDVSISATGLSPAALVQTLGGEGTMTGENLIVKGVDAAQLAQAAKGSYKPLDRAGTLFGSFGQGQTEFTTFESAFDIQSGVVNFSRINFDGPKATLQSTGNVNLPLWTVDLKNTMTVKGTDIPPFEFTVKGPLDNPAKAGGDVIENYLRSKLEKKATKLIEKQLGKFLGVPAAEQAPATAPSTAPEGEVAPAVDQSGMLEPAPTTPEPAKQIKPEDQLKQDALKALGGLLGQ